jgi:hypothetical protein
MATEMQPSSESLLNKLINGRELASVTFVRGYLQLNFDGPYLNIYTTPEIGVAGSIIKSSELGFYDKICQLVGKKVLSTKDFSDICLMLNFESDVFLRISLKPEDRKCAEAVMLQDDNGKQWSVW